MANEKKITRQQRIEWALFSELVTTAMAWSAKIDELSENLKTEEDAAQRAMLIAVQETLNKCLGDVLVAIEKSEVDPLEEIASLLKTPTPHINQ